MGVGMTLVTLNAFENPFNDVTGAFEHLGEDSGIEKESAGNAERRVVAPRRLQNRLDSRRDIGRFSRNPVATVIDKAIESFGH
jgi:hypothetical protein